MTISSKVSKSIGILLRIRHNVPNDVLLTLYHTLIEPYFSYCNIIWGTHCSKHLDQLYHKQKKVSRIIANAKWNAHTASLFRDFQLICIFCSFVLIPDCGNKHYAMLCYVCYLGVFIFFQCLLSFNSVHLYQVTFTRTFTVHSLTCKRF